MPNPLPPADLQWLRAQEKAHEGMAAECDASADTHTGDERWSANLRTVAEAHRVTQARYARIAAALEAGGQDRGELAETRKALALIGGCAGGPEMRAYLRDRGATADAGNDDTLAFLYERVARAALAPTPAAGPPQETR